MIAKQGQVRLLFLFIALLLTLSVTMVSCGGTPTPKPQPTFALEVSPGAEVQVGKSVAIVAKVEPLEKLDLKWSVSGTAEGKLNTDTGEQVVYTAGIEGTDVVVAEGTTTSGAPVKQTVALTVVGEPTAEAQVPPPPTATPVPPAATPAPPTATPQQIPTATPTAMPSPTATRTTGPTNTPSPTLIPTATPTNTPMPTPTLCVIGESRVCCTDNGGGGTEILAVEPPRIVSCIRIDMRERATGYGDSLWEVEAYGPDTGLVIGGQAYASSEQDNYGCEECFARKAVDGRMDTRWSSDWEDPQWLDIVLPDPHVNRIVLKWEQAYARQYCVTVMPPTVHNVKSGDIVAQSLSLLGEYPPEITDDIWVFVERGGVLWPQSPNPREGQPPLKLDSRWEVRTGVGDPGDMGKDFEIVVTTADQQASRSLAQTVQEWHRRGRFPGIPQSELPSGIRFWQKIFVERGPKEIQRLDASNVELPGQVALEGINDGDALPHSLTVSGTYTNVATTDHIWVLVYPPDGRHYPQCINVCGGSCAIQTGHRWEVDINLGEPDDVGKPFDIIVVLADEEAHAFFEEWRQRACDTEVFPGLYSIELPQGIDEKASVSVIRQ